MKNKFMVKLVGTMCVYAVSSVSELKQTIVDLTDDSPSVDAFFNDNHLMLSDSSLENNKWIDEDAVLTVKDNTIKVTIEPLAFTAPI